jgi:Sec-independent protein secretion pathway component TatC
MRLASFASALLPLAFAILVLVRVGLLMSSWQRASRKFIWVVVVYSALGIIANAITPGALERAIWLPVTILLFVTSIVVARAPALK